jgi:glycine/D-amino acid oxidase-like deaminating enzyme
MASSPIVVIGGGVIGLSTAYRLALKNDAPVVLLEKETVGDGSSSRAAGITTGLLWTETGVLVRKLGLRLFQELSDELDGYVYHREHGCLNLFSPEMWANSEKLLPLYDRLDAEYGVLDANDIRRRWPEMTPPDDCVGLHDPNGGYSEPDEYIAGLAKRVRELGVDIREGERVEEIVLDDGSVRGVRTQSGVVDSDRVAVTAHAWVRLVLEGLGFKVPVKTFVHQRYVSEPQAEPLDIPAVNANGDAAYFRPARGNRILIGAGTPEDSEWRVESLNFRMSEIPPPKGVVEAAVDRAKPILPVLDSVAWESEHIGLIAMSLDMEPILGPIDVAEGLFVGAAFHSGGFSYNTAAGYLLAECVVDGRASIDISRFSPNRFDADEAERYLSTDLKYGQVHARRW